jgi:hypothetical protein
MVALSVGPTTEPEWVRLVGMWYQPYAIAVAVIVLLILAAVQVVQAIAGGPTFRKHTIRGILDVLVGECGGRAKANRVTLFKKASGFRVFCTGIWRLRWRLWARSKRPKLRSLWRIQWAADYLYVYARSTGAKSQRSTAAFRVSDREPECEGVAGQVWEWDFYVLADLPRIRDTHRKLIRSLSLDEILRRRANDRLRRYVEAVRIEETDQLRAIETFSRHFMGQTVHAPGHPEWGVLLLDSSEETCPFSPQEQDGGSLGRIFRTHAEALGHVVKGN